ncbi:hypothetical protein AADEFJLK_04681 [Methylovulum psychrotolerans]|uniref:Uncharacterized protein n=1 Tax=Methylovulum psychrotolerans TaxID=1704499 RepID=A0A2S5CFH1_9GAMM|nr:hypothetical protein AADEFJLK_04681 [Methylovulum psychrotolerans]
MYYQIAWGVIVVGVIFYYAVVLAKNTHSNLFRLSISFLQFFWVIPMMFFPTLRGNFLYFYLWPAAILIAPWVLLYIKVHR